MVRFEDLNQYVILKSTSGNPKLGIFQSFINLMTITDFVVSDRIYELDFGSTSVNL